MKKKNNSLYILRLAATLLAICAAVALILAGGADPGRCQFHYEG